MRLKNTWASCIVYAAPPNSGLELHRRELSGSASSFCNVLFEYLRNAAAVATIRCRDREHGTSERRLP